jgi:hypothetical protein
VRVCFEESSLYRAFWPSAQKLDIQTVHPLHTILFGIACSYQLLHHQEYIQPFNCRSLLGSTSRRSSFVGPSMPTGITDLGLLVHHWKTKIKGGCMMTQSAFQVEPVVSFSSTPRRFLNPKGNSNGTLIFELLYNHIRTSHLHLRVLFSF